MEDKSMQKMLSKLNNTKFLKQIRFIVSSYLWGIKSVIGNLYSFYYNKRISEEDINIHTDSQTKTKSYQTDFTDNNSIYIATVAMNDFNLINIQHECLKKYLINSFVYTVFDNSNNITESKKINNYCNKHKINYVKMKQPFIKSPSENHACILNYIYQKYAINQKCRYFLLIDHDIMPIKNTNLLKAIKNKPFYGAINNKKYPYLSPIYSLFDLKEISCSKVNFMTNRYLGLDTGGANYNTLYKPYFKKHPNCIKNFSKCKLIDIENLKIGQEKNALLSYISYITLFDETWLHLGNGSNYLHIGCNKRRKQFFYKVLNNVMK